LAFNRFRETVISGTAALPSLTCGLLFTQGFAYPL